MIDLSEEADSSGELNMAPMIDIVFLLLIFFLVAATLKKVEKEKQIPLELPRAAAGQAAPSDVQALVIAIDAQGQTYVEGGRVEQAGLVERLRQASQQNADTPIRIEADKSTAYENVLRVIDTLRAAGFTQVGLKTRDAAD